MVYAWVESNKITQYADAGWKVVGVDSARDRVLMGKEKVPNVYDVR